MAPGAQTRDSIPHQVVERDRQIAHAPAGGMIDRIHAAGRHCVDHARDPNDTKLLVDLDLGEHRRVRASQMRPCPSRGVRCRPASSAAYGIFGRTGASYSALMLAARITLPHFSVSVLIRAPNSSGLLAIDSKPSVARRSLMSGSAMILTISRLSRTTISLGVPAGTATPNHDSPSTSG